ncbi:MAG TPA: non-homologous end-joining DNA ligase [Verrucomicrobiales bacterium]|nr:non-homologous end-joining DNA ligase [Verrucomicrobiales bacterium]
MSLTTYRRKRNFRKTAEPAPDKSPSPVKNGAPRFVIQKHDASRLHYDLRLELGGAYKSWAVPKGLPYTKGEKHLAVHVEDHPLAYGNFEGTIPQGEYGGGTVMLWDRGTFQPLTNTPAKDLKNGKLHFVLHGEKLKGEWYLVRLRDENQWLVIKGDTDMKPLSARKDDTSVLSGKSMRQIAGGAASPKKAAPAKKRTSAAAAPRKEKSAIHPMPSFVEPMKAKLAAAPPPGHWFYEIKFDGWRALALKGGSSVQLYSRNNKDFSEKFPEIVEAVAAVPADDAILDGEIVAIDGTGRSSFQLLQAYDIGSERPPILYYVFDILQLNGRDLTTLPLAERKAILEKLLKKEKGALKYSTTLGHDGTKLLEKARELDIEGLIGKRPDSIYEVGSRSGAWIKLKIHQEQEFIIGGYTDPEGARHSFGSLIVGYYAGSKLMAAGRVGTGFDHALLRDLHARFQKVASDKCPFANLPASEKGKWGQGITLSEMKRCHWLKPKLVCQVKFSEWTRDGRLRQPVFLGLRPDKKPAEVVRETPV